VGASIDVFLSHPKHYARYFPITTHDEKYYEMANDRGTMNIIKDVGDDEQCKQ
jgi:hypothetical protein